MNHEKKSVLQVIGEIAKETALEGKERLRKWAEAEKIKKYKQNIERKDFLGNQIVFIKNEIATTEKKVNVLVNSETEEVQVVIDGVEFDVSVDTILNQYEETLKKLEKKKDKMIKEFLTLEEKINNDVETAEKIKQMEQEELELKVKRFKTIKTPSKENAFKELIPLVLQIPMHLNEGEEFIYEEAFGSLEIRFKDNRYEYSFNGLILYLSLDDLGNIKLGKLVDWRDDNPVAISSGKSNNLLDFEWKNGSAVSFTNDIFEMTRALKYLYTNHSFNVQNV